MKNRRLLFFPLPLQGHINPMLQLANILFLKGFSITIIHTNFNSPNPSNFPHFTFLSIADGLTGSEATEAKLINFVAALNMRCVEPLRDCLKNLLSEDSEGNIISCLITDALWYSTQAVSDGFRLPRMVLRTSSVSSFPAFAAYPLLLAKGYLPIQESQLEAPVPELPPLKVRDLPVIKMQNSDTVWDIICSMIKETRISTGIIWNSFLELEESSLPLISHEFPIPNFLIGPFHRHFPASASSLLEHDESFIPWLDKQSPKSVLYVSFGSIAAVDEAEFLEIAWGLANSMQPFIWVVRPGSIEGSEWIEVLPSDFLDMVSGRGHIVKWAPQQAVLAHPAIGGFWTHCGWNSTLESLCEGVPMISMPFFGDQKINARYISDVWQIGLRLENGLDRYETEKAIRRLMVDEEGQQMRERIMSLKEKANTCLGPLGSSNQSLEKLVNYILSF